jgi:ABC-type branched-subunit amino acid transport system ATPase component
MLSVENVTKHFGGLTAVNDVSFTLKDTGITGLIGPNGSGKTTLFHLITGFYKLDRGRVYFMDKLISGVSPHAISQMGLVRTFQQTRALPFMSTLDNLLSSAPDQTGEHLTSIFLKPGRVKQEENENRERAKEILEILKLAPLAEHLAGTLSFGQQKLIEWGRVLMAKPKMILLDEPTAGINPTLIRQLIEIITRLSNEGIKIFLIEHNMPFVAEICEEIFVMDSGNLIFSGTPDKARENIRVIEAYLGREDHAA